MFKYVDINIRGLVGADASMMLAWENNKSNWRVSERTEPLTMGDIVAFVEKQNSVERVYDLDQLRYIITEAKSGKALGSVDLYEIDWEKEIAYIGILVAEASDRRKGAGLHALEKVLEQAWNAFDLELIKARIFPDNIASQKLFLKAGFVKTEKELARSNAPYLEFYCDLKEKYND